MKTDRTSIRRYRIWIAILVIAFISVVSFSFVDNDFEIAKNLDIFSTMYKELNNNYVDDIKPGEIMKTGINAMLEIPRPIYNIYF